MQGLALRVEGLRVKGLGFFTGFWGFRGLGLGF